MATKMVVKILRDHLVGQLWSHDPRSFEYASSDDPTPLLQDIAPGPITGFWSIAETVHGLHISLHVKVEDSDEGTLWMLKWL
jgi:hypothetical protein